MDVPTIIREIMNLTGLKQAQVAKKIDVSQGTISKWMSEKQAPNKTQWDEVERVFGKDPRTRSLFEGESARLGRVPVMGRVGAGAIIEPEYDQVPPDGLYAVELPFPIPDDMIAFEVDGDSMLPRYDAGDVIVVWREQRRDTDSFIGEEAAVRTADGRRYLKNILRGSRRGVYTLDSFNARAIEGVRIEWVGEIYVMLRAGQLRRMEARERATATRRANARLLATKGMTELPLPSGGKRRG